jgi:hypothetical protein
VLQLKSRDVLSLPKRYGKLPDRTREKLRRDSLVISTTSAKPEQVLSCFLRLLAPVACRFRSQSPWDVCRVTCND